MFIDLCIPYISKYISGTICFEVLLVCSTFQKGISRLGQKTPSLTRRNYPEAGPRDSFGLANLRMNAPEDRGDVPSCSPLDDGDSGVQVVAEPVPRR